MKFSAFLFMTLLLCTLAYPQSNYTAEIGKYTPNTPQASSLGRYGEYPISPATGIPKIDIPLYEISNGTIKIPLSISYHASGIRLEDVATPVGLGWSLNSGGVITRSLRGVIDYFGYSNNKIKSVDQINALKSDLAYQHHDRWRQIVGGANTAEDIQSDRYVYNFNGKSGVFVFNSANNQITTVPYSPIKVEQTTAGFKVTDTDGLIYYFEAGEASGEAYTPNYGDTAWYVTKVESQLTGEVVIFKYKDGSKYTDYVSSQSVGRGERYSFSLSSPGGGIVQLVTSTFRVAADRQLNNRIITYSPILLDEIVWKNNKVKFEYATDRLDKYKDRLTGISIASGSKIIKSIAFDNYSFWGTTETNYRMRLRGLSIYGQMQTETPEKFLFKYNEGVILPSYSTTNPNASNRGYSIDYWGYYNGTYSLNLVPSDYIDQSSTNRNPSETSMMACILNEIIYPTGGSTIFDFEANRVSNGYDYRPQESVFGGLRVKSIISRTGTQEIRKTYEYEGRATEPISIDMFKFDQRRIYTYFFGGYGLVKRYSDWEIFTSSPIFSLTGWNGSPVFYNKVVEYLGTGTLNTGKKVSYYTESVDDGLRHSYGSNVLDTDMPRHWNAFDNIDQGRLVPLLAREELYAKVDTGYVMTKRILNSYTTIQKGKIVTGVKLGFRDAWIHDPSGGSTAMEASEPYDSWNLYFSDNLAYYDSEAYLDFKVLTGTTETDYSSNGTVSNTTFYNYDTAYRILKPVSKYFINSNGTTITENYQFPFHMTAAPYVEMVSKNILDPIIKQEKSNGTGMNIISQQVFRKDGTRFLLDNVLSGRNGTLESRVKYHTYDIYSNPNYVTKDNAESFVYIWGYFGQHPIAKISNSNYAEVQSALQLQGTSIEAQAGLAIPSINSVSLRLALPKAQVTTYSYAPLVGMLTMTDARGVTEYYEYDSANRLKAVKDDEGNILRSYLYNHHTGSSN